MMITGKEIIIDENVSDAEKNAFFEELIVAQSLVANAVDIIRELDGACDSKLVAKQLWYLVVDGAHDGKAIPHDDFLHTARISRTLDSKSQAVYEVYERVVNKLLCEIKKVKGATFDD